MIEPVQKDIATPTWRKLLLLIFIVSTATHLVSISVPREVIFDEVHFGKFISAYCCTHKRFFDIHPPHAKLLIAAPARIFGYDGNFSFDHISQPYTATPVWALRIVPALTGVLLPGLVILLLLQLGSSRSISLLGGTLVVLDNAFTIQTRVIALDGILLAATIGSLCAYLAAEKRQGSTMWALFALAGALAGLAAGTKFTGLAALALLGTIVLARILQNRSWPSVQKWIVRGLVIVLSALAVYALGWVMHYQLLTQPGDGDAWYVPTGNFLADTIVWHQKMLEANYNLTAGHPDASRWWTWPAMGTSVFYWQKGISNTVHAYIYFLGNPIVWWGSSFLFVVAFAASVIRFGQRSAQRANRILWIPGVAYCIAMLPLIRVPRALFLYHYLTPLLFSLLFGLLWLDGVLKTTPSGKAWRQKFILIVLIIAALGFLWISPVTYGIALPDNVTSKILILPGWR